MQVKVLFFARSRELAGTSEAMVSLPEGAHTPAFMETLLQQVGYGRFRTCRLYLCVPSKGETYEQLAC
jgi:molybdopterin converting factor small subunit